MKIPKSAVLKKYIKIRKKQYNISLTNIRKIDKELEQLKKYETKNIAWTYIPGEQNQ